MQDGVSAKLQEGGTDQLEIVLVFTVEGHYYDYFRQAPTRQPGSWVQCKLKGATFSPEGQKSMKIREQTNDRSNKSTRQVLNFPFVVRTPIFGSLSLVSFLSGVRKEE